MASPLQKTSTSDGVDFAAVEKVEKVQYTQAITVLLVSLLAVPVCYGLYRFHTAYQSIDQDLLFGVAVLICLLIWLLSYMILRSITQSHRVFDPFLAVFSFFSFTCVVDLILAFNIDKMIDWTTFYLEHGEKYLLSSYGAAINYWDGLIHLPLYLLLIHRLANGGSILVAGAFWFGSVMNSLLVFLPGNALGSFAQDLKPSFLLNVPYVLVPIWFLTRIAKEGSDLKPRLNLFSSGPLKYLLFLGSGLVSVIQTIRFFTVLSCPLEFANSWLLVEPSLTDPLVYPAMQVLVDFFYRLPVQFYLVYAIFQQHISPFSLVIAWINLGAAAQGIFSYSVTALRAPELSDTPFYQQYSLTPFLTLQATLFFIPLLTTLALEASQPRVATKSKSE